MFPEYDSPLPEEMYRPPESGIESTTASVSVLDLIAQQAEILNNILENPDATTEQMIRAVLITQVQTLTVLQQFADAAVPTFEKLAKSPIMRMFGGKSDA